MLPRNNFSFKNLLTIWGLFSLWQNANAITPPNVSLANLVLYLPLDAEFQDYSNSNILGAGTNDSQFYVGKVDQALLCNGNAFAHGAADKLPTKERTVGLWFYPFDVHHGTIFSYGGGAPSTSYVLALNPGGTPGVDYNFYVVHSFGSSVGAFKDYYGTPSGAIVRMSGWHHWVTTTSPTGTCNYIDGKKTSCDPTIFFNTTRVTSTQFAICAAVNSAGIAPYSDANFNNFFGLVDELVVYKTALTEPEVQTLFQLGASKTTTPPSSTSQMLTTMTKTTTTSATTTAAATTLTAEQSTESVSEASATETSQSTSDNTNSTSIAIGAAIGGCAAGSLCGMAIGFFVAKKKRKNQQEVNPENNTTELNAPRKNSDYSKLPPPAPAINYEAWNTEKRL